MRSQPGDCRVTPVILKILGIMLGALVLETIGVVYMSYGLKRLEPVGKFSAGNLLRFIGRALVNPGVMFGTFFQALFFFALLYLLSQGDVSFIWPLTSLSFVFTTIAARWWLHERVSLLRWIGVCLIVLGAALISVSELQKPLPKATQAGTTSIE